MYEQATCHESVIYRLRFRLAKHFIYADDYFSQE